MNQSHPDRSGVRKQVVTFFALLLALSSTEAGGPATTGWVSLTEAEIDKTTYAHLEGAGYQVVRISNRAVIGSEIVSTVGIPALGKGSVLLCGTLTYLGILADSFAFQLLEFTADSTEDLGATVQKIVQHRDAENGREIQNLPSQLWGACFIRAARKNVTSSTIYIPVARPITAFTYQSIQHAGTVSMQLSDDYAATVSFAPGRSSK